VWSGEDNDDDEDEDEDENEDENEDGLSDSPPFDLAMIVNRFFGGTVSAAGNRYSLYLSIYPSFSLSCSVSPGSRFEKRSGNSRFTRAPRRRVRFILSFDGSRISSP